MTVHAPAPVSARLPPFLVVGDRMWQCRPTFPADLARRAVELSRQWPTLPARARRRRGTRLYTQIFRRQVLQAGELVAYLNARPELWDELVESGIPRLVTAYERAGLVEGAGHGSAG